MDEFGSIPADNHKALAAVVAIQAKRELEFKYLYNNDFNPRYASDPGPEFGVCCEQCGRRTYQLPDGLCFRCFEALRLSMAPPRSMILEIPRERVPVPVTKPATPPSKRQFNWEE